MIPPIDDDAVLPPAAAVEQQAAVPVASPSPGMLGVVALPGLALWRRWPIVGALLMIAGVMAPAFVVLMLLQHRDDLVGLLSRGNVLRGVALVALGAIFSRLIAVWLTADRVRDPVAQRKLQLWGSAMVVVLAIPTAMSVWLLSQAQGVIEQVFQDSPEAGNVVTVAPHIDPLAGQFHTVLLMGSDEGDDRLGLRTDSMILAMVNEATGRTALVSVPRNLVGLQFPPGSALAERYPAGYDDEEGGLVNALYGVVENDEELQAEYELPGLMDAGVHALIEGLSYSLGVTIDDYALVNSCGFVKVVDAIGGITIHLDKELPMPAMLRCSNYRLTPTIGPGDTFMDGTKALGYVRSRTADSDYQRMERQRILLETIANEVGIGDLLLHFGDLRDAIEGNVETSMTWDEARTLLATLENHEQEFQSIGLVPPLVEPGEEDWVQVKEVLLEIRQALADGEVFVVPTTTYAP
ncbi:MAG: LCP family protein [Actinomycetota bacterium]|nr:LCP family protein [Actinomycetota bacterium]